MTAERSGSHGAAGSALPTPLWDDALRDGGVHAPLSRLAQERRATGSVAVRALVRTKRYGERSVEEERYDVALHAASTSPYAVLAALVEAGVAVDDLQRVASGDERVVIEITASALRDRAA